MIDPELRGAGVVVTGAAGFVGSHLVERLVELGAEVTGVDRRPPPGVPSARHVLGDLLDGVADRALADAEVVFHLAARPGVRDRSPGVAAARHRDNVAAGRRVLSLVRPDARLVVASSSSVYGGARGRPSREDDPLRPRGGYARSKVALERACAERRAGGGRVVIVRPFTVVGPRQRPDMVLARWVDAAGRGEPLRVFGSLDRARDLTHVDDVVAGLLAATRVGHPDVVNLGTGVPRRLGEVVAAVRRVVGPVAVEVAPAPPVDPPRTWAATERGRAALGWVARPPDLDAVVESVRAALVLHSQDESANMG